MEHQRYFAVGLDCKGDHEVNKKEEMDSEFISKVNRWKIELTGPALPRTYEFKPLKSFPASPHPHQARLDEGKSIPSVML